MMLHQNRDPSAQIPSLPADLARSYADVIRAIAQAYDVASYKLDGMQGELPVLQRLPFFRAMLHEIPASARSLGLTPEEQAVATIAGYATGLGSLQQAVRATEGQAINDKPQQHPNLAGHVREHCLFAWEALKPILDGSDFAPTLKRAALEAVVYKGTHAAEIPLDEGTLAMKILQCIRDQDTRALLLDDKNTTYLSPRGITQTFARYFAKEWFANGQDGQAAYESNFVASLIQSEVEAALCDGFARGKAPPESGKLVNPGQVTLDLENPSEADIRRVARAFMDRRPQASSVSALETGTSLDTSRIWQSHADYLIFQMGTIFNVTSPHILDNALKHGALQDRLWHLESRLPPEDFARMRQGLQVGLMKDREFGLPPQAVSLMPYRFENLVNPAVPTGQSRYQAYVVGLATALNVMFQESRDLAPHTTVETAQRIRAVGELAGHATDWLQLDVLMKTLSPQAQQLGQAVVRSYEAQFALSLKEFVFRRDPPPTES